MRCIGASCEYSYRRNTPLSLLLFRSCLLPVKSTKKHDAESGVCPTVWGAPLADGLRQTWPSVGSGWVSTEISHTAVVVPRRLIDLMLVKITATRYLPTKRKKENRGEKKEKGKTAVSVWIRVVAVRTDKYGP